MKRLTTDSPKTNFSAMMNFAYAKNGEAYLSYVDGERDVNLAEYIATLARKRGCSEITNTDVLDGACLECDCPIAVLNVAAIQAAELRARLEQYEDAEAEGRLVVLPCKIKDSLYTTDNNYIHEWIVLRFSVTDKIRIHTQHINDYDMWDCGYRTFNPYNIGKTVFLTKEEAEQALKGESE